MAETKSFLLRVLYVGGRSCRSVGIDKPRPFTGEAQIEPLQPTHRYLRRFDHRAFSYALSTLPQLVRKRQAIFVNIFPKRDDLSTTNALYISRREGISLQANVVSPKFVTLAKPLKSRSFALLRMTRVGVGRATGKQVLRLRLAEKSAKLRSG